MTTSKHKHSGPMFGKQFIRFIAANTVAAGANIGVKAISGSMVADALSIVFGFIAGLSTSYLLCRSIVFHAAKKAHLSEAARFALINLCGLAITFMIYYVLLMFLSKIPGFALSQQSQKVVAYTGGVAAPMLLSFLLQKTFTFRQKIS